MLISYALRCAERLSLLEDLFTNLPLLGAYVMVYTLLSLYLGKLAGLTVVMRLLDRSRLRTASSRDRSTARLKDEILGERYGY